jgi:3-deoxy-manno-octulosonate cytidylyltransferase (CMP-KDO synthetase)
LEIFPNLPNSELEKAEVLEQLRVLEAGYRIKVAVVDHTYPGVDTEAQLEKLHVTYALGRTKLKRQPDETDQ